MTVIEAFRAELIRILDSADKEMTEEKFTNDLCFNHEGKWLCFPRNIYLSFVKAIKLLRKKSIDNGNYVSDSELQHILVHFLIELKYDHDQKKVQEEIDKHITRLFSHLKSMKAIETLFFVPIMDLQLGEQIRIGDSLLFNLDEKNLAIMEERFSLRLRFDKESLRNAIESFKKYNETTSIALVTVQACDFRKATELASEKAESCLNVLRLYGINAPFVLRDDYKKRIVSSLPTVRLDIKKYTIAYHSINDVSSITLLDSKKIHEIDKAGFTVLNRLLLKKANELTPLQEDLLTSLMWFGNAVKDSQGNMKFVKAIMALETLLVPEGGRNKCAKIAKQFVSIGYPSATDDDKKEAFIAMKDLYMKRSSIIHAGESDVFDEDVSKIMSWTAAIIQTILPYAEKYKTLRELIKAEFPVNDSLFQ